MLLDSISSPMLRGKVVDEVLGTCRTTRFNLERDGLLPRAVKISRRATGYPAEEISAVIKARIAGKSEDDIRALINKLHAARSAEVIA